MRGEKSLLNKISIKISEKGINEKRREKPPTKAKYVFHKKTIFLSKYYIFSIKTIKMQTSHFFHFGSFCVSSGQF